MSDRPISAPVDDLVAIRAREAAATPGPWLTPDEAGDPYKAPALASDRLCAVLDHEGCDCWPWAREEDMEFAYAARADIPRLIMVVDELRAILAPLLDGPMRHDASGTQYCIACDRTSRGDWRLPENHRPDCPVLDAARLLGKETLDV